jgi:tetratricopeptide (TPR) repeat protein
MSKENGCLLPLLILVLEATVLSGSGVSPDLRWCRLFLMIPVSLIIAYIVYYITNGQFHEAYGLRPFTWTERLLTEARILWDYIGSWFFPTGTSRGVYADDYPFSTGLFYPSGTFIAVVGIILMIVVGISSRVWPTLRLAVLFFLVGHLLESTILPLELYFEHRNYLPVMFLFYPLVLMIERMVQSKPLRYLLGGLFIILPATVTAQRASLWGDEYALAEASADHYPYSQRANRVLANVLEKKGRPELAVQRLLDAEKRLPENIPIKMHLLTLYCGFGLDVQDTFSALVNLIRVSDYDFKTYRLLESVIIMIHEQNCVDLGTANAHVFLDNLDLVAQGRNGPMRQIYHLRGVLYAEENEGKSALTAFVRAQEYYSDVDAGLLEVAILATNEHYDEAMILLDMVEAILQKRGEKSIWQTTLDYPDEIIRLRSIIRQDAGKKYPGD